MNLAAVMDEVALAMESLTGLRVVGWPAAKVPAPGGYVSYPQSVDYDQTYGRGVDQFTDLPIVLLAGDVVSRTARDKVATWATGSGVTSLKQAVEAWSWTTCDSVQITSCEFAGETQSGVEYLAALFKATVVGPGEE